MDYLPESLKIFGDYNQFILYKITPSKNRPGKLDKLPLDYRTGHVANAHDPNIWLNITDALKFNNQKHIKGHSGIGFVLTKNDPFWFLDIDNCLVGNEWSPLALTLMTVLSGCAIEISLSRTGLHLFGCGKTPPHSNKNSQYGIEFYTSDRFVALTALDAMGNAAKDCTMLLPSIINSYFPPSIINSTLTLTWTDESTEGWQGSDLELIDRALRSQSGRAVFGGGASFKDLWEANTDKLSQAYPDQFRDRQYDESSADAALAQHLAFWTGNNCERIKILMLQSALIRDKWHREDYLRITILNACSKQKEFYQYKAPQNILIQSIIEDLEKPTDVTGATFLTLDNQKDLFKGCTYVCDIHRALIPGGDLLKSDQFKVMYGGFSFAMDAINQRVSRDAWEAFTQSQGFRAPRAHSACFRPIDAPGKLIEDNGRLLANVWWPITTKKIDGDPTPFLNHLKKLLPDERDQTIALAYFAALVQFKGIKFQWAPIFQGVEGNGKTLFSRCISYAIGDKYSHFPKASQIAAKFNDWMYCKLFVGVEDIYVPDAQYEVIEAIKPMITLNRQEIEPKGGNKFTADIYCNFVLNTNHKEGIRKTQNNRIFAPFYTAQQSVDDLKRDGMDDHYFIKLYNWLRKEGYAIVNQFLTGYSIPDEFNPAISCQRAPATSTTSEAIKYGMGGIEQEINEAIEQELTGFKDGWVSSIYLDRLLERINATRKIPHNKRRELLQSLGYDWHPHLNNGRVNNLILPDGGKPRLFILKNHPNCNIKHAPEIAKAYTQAQISL